MKIIILAGGTGKRFWPASRKDAPKQFLPVIGDQPLVQLKYEYLRLGFEPEDIFICTGKQYEKEVRDILPELPEENFILEPAMRDTGPAVLYSALYVENLYPGSIISTQWSDHYIKDPETFVKALHAAEEQVKETQKSIIIGVPARFPSPHRGYIKFGKKIKGLENENKLVLCEFVRFVEKPSYEVAVEYVRSGDYAWNPGYFVTTADEISKKYQQFAPQLYETLNKCVASNDEAERERLYNEIDKVAFDYIFPENLETSEAQVINVDMGWCDVGEWISLKEALQTNPEENIIDGNVFDLNSEDSLIYNFDDSKLVATVNLQGMIVVNTKDVVAVFPQEYNSKLKELLKKLEEKTGESYL